MKKDAQIAYIPFPGEKTTIKTFTKLIEKEKINFVIVETSERGAIRTIGGTTMELISIAVRCKIPVFLVREGSDEPLQRSGKEIERLHSVQIGGILLERAYSDNIIEIQKDIKKFFEKCQFVKQNEIAEYVVYRMINKYRYEKSDYWRYVFSSGLKIYNWKE